MEATRHSHHYPAGRDPIDTRPSLTHSHDRGHNAHDHDEEIEVVIGRLLVKRNYTGLTPRAQHAVAIGIAAMRAALVPYGFVDAQHDAPPPSSRELRAPLVTRVKGERQTERVPKLNHVELLAHVFNDPEHEIDSNPDFTSAAYAQRWHAADHAQNERAHSHGGAS